MSERYRDENGLAHDIGSNYSPIKNETNNVSTNSERYRDENGLAHDINNSVPSQSYYSDQLPGAQDTPAENSNQLPLNFVSQEPTPYWEPNKIVERYDWYRANPDKEPEIAGPTKQETETAYNYLANTKFKNQPKSDWEMTDYASDQYYQNVISKWDDPRKPQTKEAAATISQAEELMKQPEMQGTWQDLNLVGKAAVTFIPTGAVTEGAPAITKVTQSIIPAIGSYLPGYLAAGGAAAATAAVIAATGGTAAIPIAAIATAGGIATGLLQAVNYITGKDIPILSKVGNWLDVIGQSAEKAFVGVPAAYKAIHPEIDKNNDWTYSNPKLEALGFEKKPSLVGDVVDNFIDLASEIIKVPFGNSTIQEGELKKAWGVSAIGLEQNPFIANTALNIANKIFGYETADYGEYYRYELGTNEPQKAALSPDEMNLALMKAVDIYSKMVNPETGKPYTGREIEDNILLRVATSQYGISGALNDIIGQELLDPTNYAGNIQNSIVNTYAKVTGNNPLQTATEINAGNNYAPFPLNALSSKQKTGGLTELAEIHKKVLRGELGENAVKVDILTESQRNTAGLTPEGKYKELQPTQPTQATGLIGKITNAIQNLTNLTPVAKAAELSKMALDMTSAVILMSDGNPETIRTNVLKLADMMEVSPDDAVSKIYGTAEQRTITDALKAIATSPKFDGIVNQLKATESMRMNLSLLSSQIGKNPKEIIQGIIDNPQSIKRLIQEAAAKNNGSIMGQMLTDDGTLIIDQFQVFTDKKNPLPYTVEQVAAEYNKLFADTLSDYVTELYDVKPDNVAIRISDMMKKFQSLLLLSLNPAFLANNFTNDIVTRAAEGVFGFPNINDWVENEMGIAPARMYDSMQEFRGAENTVTGSYSIVNEKLKNAKRKGDKVDKISDLLSKVNSVMPGTKINGKIEGVESARANVVGQMQYMHKFWKAGKGFDELPVELKQRIDSVIPNGSWLLYSGIQSGYNFDKIIKNLFGAYVKPDIGTILEGIVQSKFPIDSEIVNELFAKTGKLSELQTLLDNTNTPEERAAVIESIRNRSKDIVKMYSDNQIISEAENVRNDIALSGDKNQYRQQAMKYISYVSVTREDQWLRSRESYRDAYAKKVHDSLTQGEWNSYIASVTSRNWAEWNTFNAREKQVYAGIIRALGFTDDISAEYLSLVTDYQSNWNNFYKYQQQKINEYYGGNITWEDYEADTDKAYDEHFQSEMLIQEKLNESFLRGYSASGFDVAPIRELQNRIVTIRHEMHDMQVDIRQRTRSSTKGMERADADKIRNEMYLAFEPEYNGKIEEIANLQSQIGAEIGKDPVEKAREQSGRPIESVPTQEPVNELDKVSQILKAKIILQDADVIRSNAETDFENAIHETEADRQAKVERPEYYTRDKIRQAFVDSGLPEEKVNLYMELFDAREKQWNKDNPGKNFYNEALRVINISKDASIDSNMLYQTYSGAVDTASPWYSHMETVIADKFPEKMKAESARNWLIKQGVSTEELRWSGVDDFLADATGQVTKADMQSVIDSNQLRIEENYENYSDVYSQAEEFYRNGLEYQNSIQEDYANGAHLILNLIGGDEEILSNIIYYKQNPDLINDFYYGVDYEKTKPYIELVEKEYPEILDNLVQIKNNIDEYNLRIKEFNNYLNEHTKYEEYTTKGDYTNYAELIITIPNNKQPYQSSHWNDIKNPIFHVRFNERIDTQGRRILYIEEFQSDWIQDIQKGKDVPDAPFKDTWERKAIQRMMNYAAQNGYDMVAWTPGLIQMERWGLGGVADTIEYRRHPSFDNFLIAKKGNNLVFSDFVTEKKLPDYIGKEKADLILNSQEYKDTGIYTLSGEQMAVSDKWPLKVYDQDITNATKKIVKKYGSDLETITIDTGEEGMLDVSAYKVTPEMKEPQRLFQSLNEKIKGEFQVIDGDTAIRLLESKDVTTMVHESGHLFRRTLNNKQMAEYAQWSGFKSAEEYLDYDNRYWAKTLSEEESKRYVEAEEKFARGWEQYLIEGKAPIPSLTRVFKAFTEWMLDIYKAIKRALTKDYSKQKEFVFNGKPLDIKAEINGVRLVDIFDSMLAEQEANTAENTMSAFMTLEMEAMRLASAIEQFDAGNPITLEQLKQIATPDYQNTELTPDANIIPDIDEYTTDEIYAKKINPIMRGEYMIAARVYKDGFPIAYYPYNLRMKEIHYNGKVYDVLGIDIDNADQYLFWDGEQVITVDTKQDLADLDIMDDMPTIPQGKQESFLTMPAGEAYEELVSKYLDPILDELHDRYEAELTRNKVAGSFSQLDNDSKVALYKYMNGVKDSLAATKYNALKFGEMKRDQALLNYNKRYGFDTYLTVISPYQFWYTRSMLNWAKRMIDKPVWFTTYARLKEKEELFERDENPTRLSGTTKFPMPYLEDWMGGALHIDTMSQFFPFMQFLNKAESYSQDKNFLNKKVESLLKEQLDEGTIKSQDYLEALRTKNTPAWNDAYAIISENYSKDPSLGGLAQQYMQLPFLLTWAINKAKGKEGEIGNLPITRTGLSLQTLTKGIPVLETAGNIVGGAMTLPEQGLRKLFGLDYNVLGTYGDYAIKKQLSQMGNSGEISREEMLDAQRTFSGPAYEEAYRRQREELMLKTQGAAAIDAMKAFIQGDAKITDVLQALFVAPFGGSVYPEDEYQLRQKQDELEQAYDDQASGKRPNAVSEFFDANPTFIGRKASFIDDPEELNKYIAYQNITNAYYNLPIAQQLAVQQSLGTDFYNAIINKETRNYKATSYDDLLTWEYAMRGDIPNLPASEINKAKQNAPKITYYTQPVVDEVETFKQLTKQNFPANIEEMNRYYYTLPKDERYAYLNLHPEVGEFQQFKRNYRNANQGYDTYLEDYSAFQNEIMAVRCYAEMAESVRNDLEYSNVTGKHMRGSSINQLKHLYGKYADPNFNTFDEFVEILKGYE